MEPFRVGFSYVAFAFVDMLRRHPLASIPKRIEGSLTSYVSNSKKSGMSSLGHFIDKESTVNGSLQKGTRLSFFDMYSIHVEEEERGRVDC